MRQVEAVLNDETAVDEDDARIRARADWTLGVLVQYALAMRPLRTAIAPAFANGM